MAMAAMGHARLRTETSRFTVLIILVVITTVTERRVVAISLLLTNVTSVDILIRNWIESATKVLVVTLTLALIARERRRPVGYGRYVSTLSPEMVGKSSPTCHNIIRVVTSKEGGHRKSQT